MNKKSPDIKSSEITPEEDYLNRREFIAGTSAIMLGLPAADFLKPPEADAKQKPSVTRNKQFIAKEKLTAWEDASSFVNFYELSMNKKEAVRLGQKFSTRPWTVTVEGLIKKPRVFDIDMLTKMFPLEERVYRFRCVEGWSMVIPWMGFPLADFIKLCEPLGAAKYIEFYTLYDPKQMPGQLSKVLSWPYLEGLRLDEAMHPLTLICLGMYGKLLPAQNGAPLRLMVPWKYGFKSIKSIVRIRFVENMPLTAWMKAIPEEYGFYANVNPQVDHPRWSQAQEQRIGVEGKQKTLLFNGYEDQVAGLYAGMDLEKFF